MEGKFVSRELFDERSNRFLGLLENDKNSIEMLTKLVNQHDKTLERIIAVEEENIKDRERDKNRIDRMGQILQKLVTLEEERGKKVDNHHERLTELEKKPMKRIDAIMTAVITGVIMLVLGAIFGFLI